MEGIEGALLHRVRMEYLEMPGLSLTCKQASRLWNLETSLCERILSELVAERFLAQAATGTFLRRVAAA
jgi:hypothetical protein